LRTKDYLTGQYAGRNIRLTYTAKNRLNYIYDTDANGDEAWTGTRWTAHDARGNTAHYGHLHLVHDMTNQPIGMFGRGTGSNGSTWTNFGQQAHLYDANKRRVKTVERTSAGVVTAIRYNIFDAAGTLVQVYNATTDTKTDYVSGPNGALARIKRHAGTDTTTFIHADHLGTARSGTAWGGQELWEDYHTPFGASLIHPDATDDQGDYTGHIRDKKTGLTYMQARYQDPLIGRFLSEDPVTFLQTGEPGMFNRYAYTLNDPINKIDPDGRYYYNPITNNNLIDTQGEILYAAHEAITKPAIETALTIHAGARLGSLITRGVMAMRARAVAQTGVQVTRAGQVTNTVAANMVGGGISSATIEAGTQIVRDGEISDLEAVVDQGVTGAVLSGAGSVASEGIQTGASQLGKTRDVSSAAPAALGAAASDLIGAAGTAAGAEVRASDYFETEADQVPHF